ncbi:MAG: hypothetical protein HRT61_05950 [Ekhidna sp.]|nr:hypothetical protein [Ekhidna sp.]
MKNDFDDPITYLPSIVNNYQVDSALSWDIWEGKFDISSKKNQSFQILDPSLRFAYSSSYVDTYNDGAVWEGKGISSSINFGFQGRKGFLSYTFAPVVFYAQNQDFYVAPSPFNKNEFSYPFERKIDWVERYGNSSLNKFHFGQSELRLTYRKVSLGLSTQNFMLGPAQVAPILMSNNAGGIPHIDFGSARPYATKLGQLEYKIFWGLMNESDFFDENPDNDQRYFAGAVIGFQPRYVPGLSIGLNRVMYREMFDGDFSPLDIIAPLWKNIEDPALPNDNYDQMFSLMMKWKFKEYGFDGYMEFARNDLPGTIVDLFENPERTRAVTMGLVKTFDFSNEHVLRLVYEHTKLNKIKMSTATIGHPTYYVHEIVDNGYTNNGQLMGAYIGPGSNAHHIRLQYFTEKGRIGVSFDRVRWNDDYFIDNFAGNPDLEPNDQRYRWGINYLRFIGNFVLDLDYQVGYRKNWYYEDDLKIWNQYLGLNISYLVR